MSQSVFLPGTEQALTGTSEGCAVVWTPKQNSESVYVWDQYGLVHNMRQRLHKFIVSYYSTCELA